MTINNLNSVEWLIEQFKQDQKYPALSKKEWKKVFDKAFELHLDDIEFHYDQGYAAGYKGALEFITQWAISNLIPPHNEQQ